MSVRDIFENLTYSLAVSIGGADLSQYVESFNFREALGQKATGTLVLVDRDADGLMVRPSRFGPDGGDNPLHPHDLTRDQTVQVIPTAAGMPGEYPAFLISDVDFSPSGVCTVSLEDYHALIEQDGINMADILAEAGSTATAHSAIEEMAEEVDLEVECDFPDYAINELRRSQGSRLAWIGQLGRAYQCFTQFRGTRMHVLRPRYIGSDFALTDYLNLTNLTFRETTAGHKNRYRATRLQPGTNRIVGEARGTSYGRNGQTQAAISPPSRVVQAHIKTLEKGVLVTWVAFDEADNPVSTSNTGTFISATPIARVEFTFSPISPAFDLSIIEAQFHVYFLGSTGSPTFDTQFSDTVDLDPEQGFYGVREEFTVMEDPIWPTAELATAAATNMAIENADHRYISSWASWLNPRVRAGTRVSITDWTMRQAGSSWLVREVDHSYTNTSAVMTISCTRRRTDD